MTETTTTPEQAFAIALASFQEAIPPVRKENTAQVKSDKATYSYKYADLTDITEAALPLLAKHGLSWSARPMMTEHGFVLRYALLHEGGHREEGDYPLADPSRFTSQQIGSYVTYARRYCLCAVTGIAPGGDDDDGEKASDARSADPLPRAPRTRGATTRHNGPDDPTTHVDEWTTPQRVTDTEWIDGFRRRLTACTKPSEVRGLDTEAHVQYGDGKLTADDAKALKVEIDSRMQELTGELVTP